MLKPKPKPCKGTTANTKGWGCGTLTAYRVYGLGKFCCYPDWLLNSEAGKIKLKKAELKATKPRRDLEKAREEKQRTDKLQQHVVNTRTVVHNYIKERDKGKPCISCGTPWRPDFQAGHYKKAELFEWLRFHPYNINGQCVGCNIHNDGNEAQYSVNLPYRIGEEAFKELTRLAALEKKRGAKHWTREELADIRKHFKELTTHLK